MLKKTFLYSIIFLICSCVTNKDLDILSVGDNTSVEYSNEKIKLTEGDLIYVEIKSLTPTDYDFFNNKENSNSKLLNPNLYGYVINDQGNVTLPVLGEIFVEGKTIKETEETIKGLAKEYFLNPFVKVVLLNFNVTILGEVNSPGLKNIYETSSNILDVVGLADGFTSIANRKKIKIIRLNNNDNPEIFHLNLTNINSTSNNGFNVKSNDIIYVEPLKKRFFVINNLSSGLSILISSLTLYFLLTNN